METREKTKMSTKSKLGEGSTAEKWAARCVYSGELTIVAGVGDMFKTIATVEHIAARSEQEANARLIAKAPLLIEAREAFAGILAALSQNKTFPADVEAAKEFARALLQKLEA